MPESFLTRNQHIPRNSINNFEESIHLKSILCIEVHVFRVLYIFIICASGGGGGEGGVVSICEVSMATNMV